MSRRATLATLLVVAAAGLAVVVARLAGGEPAGTRAPLVIGISGERPEAFADPRLRALHLRAARVQASWDLALPERADAVAYPGLADERARLAAWLAAAPRAGVRDVLLALKTSRDGEPAPDAATYRRGLDALLAWVAGHPGGALVRAVSAWNEPNLDGPSRVSPERAGAYAAQVRDACAARRCLPVAGDFADRSVTAADLAAYRAAAGAGIRVWAWHAYEDGWDRARDGSLPRLRAFLAALPAGAEVWLTEQGGIVRRGRAGDDGRRVQSPARAAADLAFLLDRAPALDRRIRRFYVYQWRGEPPPRWDSGLIAPDGSTRPGYEVLERAEGAGRT